MEEKLTLWQKLLDIQTRVSGLGKDGKGYDYKYVTGEKILGVIKPLMNEHGILLKQEVVSIQNTRQDFKAGKEQKDKNEVLSCVMMRMTWIDVHSGEREVCEWGANGLNGWDKGVGSAMTYGERYFLLKFFHIATDEDDVDFPKPEEKPPVRKEDPVPVKKKELISTMAEWQVAIKSLIDGTVTISKIRTKYELSQKNEELLIAEAAK